MGRRNFRILRRSQTGKGEITTFGQSGDGAYPSPPRVGRVDQGWQPGSPIPLGETTPDLTPPQMGTLGQTQYVPIPGINATWAQRQQNPANMTHIPGWGDTLTSRPGAGVTAGGLQHMQGVSNATDASPQPPGTQPTAASQPDVSTPPPPGSDPRLIIAWQMKMRKMYGPGGGQRVGGGYGPGGNVPDQGGGNV